MWRGARELQCIQATWLDGLSVEQFLGIFGKDMRNPEAHTGKEVLCEKAFLLWRERNLFAVPRFVDLLEDEECRSILTRKYDFELQDFYKMNAERT